MIGRTGPLILRHGVLLQNVTFLSTFSSNFMAASEFFITFAVKVKPKRQ
jgi:hypothetical protein